MAAGRGERLTPITDHKPKALVEMSGSLTLLDLAIRSLRATGLEELVIVIGYMGHKVEEALAKQEGIRLIKNPEYWRENGYSLLRAREAVGSEDFILVMGDHLFEPRLASLAASSGPLTLCVDREPRYLPDPDEATKVRLGPGGRVEAIGKSLSTWDAYDTGVFACNELMFWAAEELSKRRFSITISDCVNFLAARGVDFKTADATGLLWSDVDTLDALEHARKEVLPALLKRLGSR